MNGIWKSTAMAAGTILAVISLTLIPATEAMGKENRRSNNSARIHRHRGSLKGNNVTSAGSGTHSSLSAKSGGKRGKAIFDDPFFFDVGAIKRPTSER